MSINDGGPAFPNTQDASKWDSRDTGMTLRDYFAAKAMQGLCAGLQAKDNVDAVPELAYAMADAMLKERNK